MQRALLQYDRPANRKLLGAALAELDSLHVLPKFLAASGPARTRQRPTAGSQPPASERGPRGRPAARRGKTARRRRDRP